MQATGSFIEQLVLLLFHFAKRPVQLSREVDACSHGKELLRGTKALFPAHPDRLLAEVDPRDDHRFEAVEPFLLCRIVGSQLTQPRQMRAQGGSGLRSICKQIFVSQDQVAALAALEVRKVGGYFFDLLQYFLRVRNPTRVPAQLAGEAVRKGCCGNQ